jgi:hypothetical protein
MYRRDINVRMSTIIGFVGGGIGFSLQQNINLLNYRAASAQIIAIAIVVSLMDYVSSALRQRTIGFTWWAACSGAHPACPIHDSRYRRRLLECA